MKLFGKKKSEEARDCVDGFNPEAMKNTKAKQEIDNTIKILGGGCAKCKALESSVKEALAELGLKIEIEHIKDYAEIAAYGVMTTPALIYNEKVISYGKVLTKNEIIKLIRKQDFN